MTKNAKYALNAVMVIIIGIGVMVGMQSVDRAARQGYAGNSRLFWPLFPGMIAGWILSGGHEGIEVVASVICWVVDTAFYWLLSMLLFWTLRKLVNRPSQPL